ncbi:MAG: VOC family protein [Chloroflexi bacterium]|nr:VOC family protein [Chloroflexota bacterium]MDA1272372.1 VOC family protein [Chloroflexota bacterium]
MLERLRQVAFLVKDLADAKDLYRRYLGLETCHSADLSRYGVLNAVLHAGNGTFIELLQPDDSDSSAARYLERRGEAPYMLIFETSEYDRLVPHLRSLGVRLSEEAEDDYRHAFIHPSSANGALLEIIEVSPSFKARNPWPAAGPDWQALEREPLTKQLRQMAVLVRDLDQAVARWEEMFGIKATKRFHVSFTDLEIAVLPLGGKDTFIELAQPTGDDVPSARFLKRYGEGIYLTIYEIEDSLAMDDHLKEQEARYTSSRVTTNYVNLGFNSIWLHPAGMKGAFTQLSQVLVDDNPWPPAGDDWHLG